MDKWKLVPKVMKMWRERNKMEEKYLLHLCFFFLQFENRLPHLIFVVGTPWPISWDVGAVRAGLESQCSGRWWVTADLCREEWRDWRDAPGVLFWKLFMDGLSSESPVVGKLVYTVKSSIFYLPFPFSSFQLTFNTATNLILCKNPWVSYHV